MNILCYPYYYFPTKAAGGEHYLHSVLKGLQSLGHQVRIAALGTEQYAYDGIEVYPHAGMQTLYSEGNENCIWADVIFTQLIGCAHGYNKAIQHKKPLVFFTHNTSRHYAVNGARVVYNSHTLASLNLFPNESTVLQPLVYPGIRSAGRKIALINCNMNKGGDIFIALAKRLPQYSFMGVLGSYGEQIRGKLPNLTYAANQIGIDWSDIGLLLVLSEFESWSLAASEAICHGVPVICNDLPSLRENLSYAGIYIDRNNVDLYVKTIEYLMWDSSKQVELCLKRASEYGSDNRLKVFNEWLCSTIEKKQ